MKTTSIALTMMLCFVGFAATVSENTNLGTWKLDELQGNEAQA
jgi:hypothetical protein